MKNVVFKRSLLLAICCTVFGLMGKAQTALDTAMARYGSDYLQERVYIQFDKGLYSPGETIWFKAYLMAGIENSEISKSFYIDWTDVDGNLIQHTSVPVIESSARGQLDIPAGYSGKIINARAYTKWMLNFDTAFLFNKAIRIAPKKASAGNAQPVKFKSLIQFFPEGGDLIEGISSKVAFKATNEIGEPVKAKGTIVSSKGETVGKFASVHDGMGLFTLEPAAGVTYKAKWTDDANNAYETALPAAKTFGATVAIMSSQGKANFLIKRSENVPASLKQLHIIATTYQQLVYKANVRLEETSAIGGSIPTAQLPSGILQVTLFDDSYTPIAERICFVNNNDAIFKPNVDFYSLNLGKRGKNTLEIDLPDTIVANLSVAVTDAGIAADSSNNLVSHLLLGSELKGYIHNPWYYFSADNDTVKNNLDYVMLTNGWRRFKWGELVKGVLPQIKYPADTAYAELGGKVFGATPMQMRESGDLFAIVQGKDSSTQMLTFPIAKDGSFKQPGFVFFDSLKIHYQFGKARGLESAVEVRFTSGLLTTPGKVNLNKSLFAYMLNDTTGNARAKYFADEQARLEKLLHGTTLEGVTVRSRTKSPQQVLDEKYTSGLFTGGNSTSFDVANDIAAQGQMNIFTYLQGRVAGLQITGAPSNTSLMWRGGAPDVYLDEMKVDVQQLQNIPMPDVAYVKAFSPPFFGSFGGGSNGAIAVYTRKGGDVKQAPGKGLPTKIVWGYSTIKEFYSPNYETFDERNEHSDVRSTLYWNPYVLTTQENHKIRLTFYNNDITEKYRVIVEGVTKDGKLTHIEQVYE